MSLTAQQKLSAAILRVADPVSGTAPYFGVALRGLLRRQMTPEIEAHLAGRSGGAATIGVTGDGIMYWSEAFVMNQSVEELTFVLMHEVMHVLLKHTDRFKQVGAITPELQAVANLAADACINEQLRKTWPKLGQNAVYPETLEQPLELIFEDRYQRLKKEVQKQKQQQQKAGGGQGQGKAQGAGGVTKGQCGGCGGEPLPGENKGEGRSEAQMERVRRETAGAVQAHVAQRGRGTVPAELEVWADATLGPPKIDWRVKLGQLVRSAVAYKAGMVDLYYGRPSRRQAGLGFGVGRAHLPSYRAPVPRVGCLVDTSGSMSQQSLAAAMTEVQGVIKAVGGNITFAVVDAVLHGIKDVDTVEQACAMLKGGGGTNLMEGFEALATRHTDVIIVCTDGYIGESYPEAMAAKVIWCIIDGDKNFAPRYGDVVVLDDVTEKAA